MSLNVSRWQAARRQFNYSPVLQFFLRMIVSTALDARKMQDDGTPSDEALLARAWFAKETKPGDEDYFPSFSCCCNVLERDEATERYMTLRIIDGYDLQPSADGNAADIQMVQRWKLTEPKNEGEKPRYVSYTQRCVWMLRENPPDFDTEECDKRLEYLLANPLPDDDPEPVFEGYRVVPALDQMSLFGMVQ